MAKGAYIGVGNFVPRALPDGYTQVEYIESTGTQYINTGFKPNNNTRVVMDLLYTGSESVSNEFGAWNAGNAGAFISLTTGRNNLYPFYGSTSKQVSVDRTTRHIVDMDKNVVKMNGESMITFDAVTFACVYPLFLCCFNSYGAAQNMTALRIYSCQIYDNGTLVRDYVPCKNASGVVGLYDLANDVFYQNAGSGTFAAGATHNSVARKIKKGYIGIENVARKIKKAYIGIGGVARPCWSGGELAYYGTVTPLSAARSQLAATTVGNYALFGGGNVNGYATDTVDAYNSVLTRTTPRAISFYAYALAATTVGNYALFGGGCGDSRSYRANVTTYDAALTLKSATDLSIARGLLAATTVGNYALFGGGRGSSSSVRANVDAYDESLSRTQSTQLSTTRYSLAATTVGNYALFGGGMNGSNQENIFANVDTYDASLTKKTAKALSAAKYGLAATTVGNYAIFAGGGFNSPSTTVDAYDTSLTRVSVAELSGGRWFLKATKLAEYAIFAGGENLSGAVNTVDVYDKSLTKVNREFVLATNRSNFAATTVGNYALFGGGFYEYVRDTVEAFTVA